MVQRIGHGTCAGQRRQEGAGRDDHVVLYRSCAPREAERLLVGGLDASRAIGLFVVNSLQYQRNDGDDREIIRRARMLSARLLRAMAEPARCT